MSQHELADVLDVAQAINTLLLLQTDIDHTDIHNATLAFIEDNTDLDLSAFAQVIDDANGCCLSGDEAEEPFDIFTNLSTQAQAHASARAALRRMMGIKEDN